MADLADLERRLRDLEAREEARALAAQKAGTPAMATFDNTAHAPMVGTWLADTNRAECKYCRQRIAQDPADDPDTPGMWRYIRDPHCHARASGAAAIGE